MTLLVIFYMENLLYRHFIAAIVMMVGKFNIIMTLP